MDGSRRSARTAWWDSLSGRRSEPVTHLGHGPPPQDLSLGTGCAQASGQPVNLRIPVQRRLPLATGRPTLGIEPVGQLAVVDAKFDTGIPPTADQYEAVVGD